MGTQLNLGAERGLFAELENPVVSSKQIRDLAVEVGISLLMRRARGLELTRVDQTFVSAFSAGLPNGHCVEGITGL